MKDELDYSLDQLNKAFLKLKEGSLKVRDDLQRDGVIQRFEFTFEILWKTLRLFLLEKGIVAKTPKDCLKEAFRVGWLKEEDVFNQMLEDRNKTSHIYEEKKSIEILNHIQQQYIIVLEGVLKNLKEILKKN